MLTFDRYPNPSVTIGLALSTSPAALDPSSAEPFYIVVTARILNTPYSDKPFTLNTHLSPLEELSNRSFHNIVCVTGPPTKQIEIWPRGWSNFEWDSEDLRSAWEFVTLAPKGQGVYSTRHEIRRDLIQQADPRKGEHYEVSFTDKCLGTRWSAHADLAELEGVRLRTWRNAEKRSQEEKEVQEEDPEERAEIERERREKYRDVPVEMGEDPDTLAMVIEGEIEFEVV